MPQIPDTESPPSIRFNYVTEADLTNYVTEDELNQAQVGLSDTQVVQVGQAIDLAVGYVNVKEGGAVGDGVTDDTAAIQSAIDTAPAGSTIFFPPGIYLVTTITLASDVTFIGAGGATLQQDTGQVLPVLYHAQTANNPVQDADLLTNVTVRNLSFIGDLTDPGTEAARIGIFVGQGTDIRIENCTFTDFVSSAVCAQNCLRVWFLDNYVDTCAQTGYGRNALDFNGSDNFSDTSARTGLFVAQGNVVKNSNNGGVCAVSFEATNLRAIITDNHCEDIAWAGLVVEAGYAQDSIVANNEVLSAGTGIVFLDTESTHGATVVAKNNIIANNYVNTDASYGTTSKGIESNSSNMTITGNVIRTPQIQMRVLGNATTSVDANNLSITGNVLISNQTSTGDRTPLLSIGGGSNAAITGNSFTVEASAKSLGGIRLFDWANATIVGNTTYLTGQDGIVVEDATNVVVADNMIADPNTGDDGTSGIRLPGTTSTDLTIRDNHMVNTAGGPAKMTYGISATVTTATRIIAEGNTIRAPQGVAINGETKFVRLKDNYTDESSTVASAATVTLPVGHDFITISGTTTITSVTASYSGRRVTLLFSGALTFTDGSNLKLSANLVTTADDTLSLACDGTNWYETGRSVN